MIKKKEKKEAVPLEFGVFLSPPPGGINYYRPPPRCTTTLTIPRVVVSPRSDVRVRQSGDVHTIVSSCCRRNIRATTTAKGVVVVLETARHDVPSSSTLNHRQTPRRRYLITAITYVSLAVFFLHQTTSSVRLHFWNAARETRKSTDWNT